MSNQDSAESFNGIEQFVVNIDRNLIRTKGGSRRHLHLHVQAGSSTLGAERPPVRVGFALDRSGSMGGGKLTLAAAAVCEAIALLQPRDEFNVVFFDEHLDTVVPQAAATAENKREAQRRCMEVLPRGSTNLSGGWALACANLSAEHKPDNLDLCVLLTDGQANAGIVDPDQLREHSREMRMRGVVTTCIGVGEGFAERLLKGMADAADGRFYFAEGAGQLRTVMAGEIGEALEVTAPGVAIEIVPRNGGRSGALGSFRTSLKDTTLRMELGDLCSNQTVDTVVEILCPEGQLGETLIFDVRLVGREGELLAPLQTMQLTYAERDQVIAQPRDRQVDRLVAQHHADRTRIKAVALNREREFGEAGALLRRVARRIAEYAGGDSQLEQLVRELERDAMRSSEQIREMDLKTDFTQAHNRTKSRTTTGTSTRRGS